MFWKILRSRGILTGESPILVDIWGNGSGLVSVIGQARDDFRHAFLAPSASVDLNSIRDYDISSGPEITIVLGKNGHKKSILGSKRLINQWRKLT
jgi:hypothetical protein